MPTVESARRFAQIRISWQTCVNHSEKNAEHALHMSSTLLSYPFPPVIPSSLPSLSIHHPSFASVQCSPCLFHHSSTYPCLPPSSALFLPHPLPPSVPCSSPCLLLSPPCTRLSPPASLDPLLPHTDLHYPTGFNFVQGRHTA